LSPLHLCLGRDKTSNYDTLQSSFAIGIQNGSVQYHNYHNIYLSETQKNKRPSYKHKFSSKLYECASNCGLCQWNLHYDNLYSIIIASEVWLF